MKPPFIVNNNNNIKRPKATPEFITKAGIPFLIALYGAKSEETSQQPIYHQFFEQYVTKSLFKLAFLPLTDDAA